MATTQIWRLQTNTSGGKIGQYCINHNVAAVGWSLLNLSPKDREAISSFEQYCVYAEEAYNKFNSVQRLYSDVQKGDFIWMRYNGVYYMGCVGEKSKWYFNSNEEATSLDASNQITDVHWIKYEQGDESAVPGALTTAFIKGSTLQRINKPGVLEFSQLFYNQYAKKRVYDVSLEITSDNFYSLLSPSDCEDLLCMWLYHKYNYVCVPSTNKVATPLYECVLLNPKNGAHVYIQVKNGCVDIDANDYMQLQGEVWLLTTQGKVININSNNIHVVDPEKLYEFAISDEAENILPPSIRSWVHFLEENEFQKHQGNIKGIIFDTNKSFDPTSQNYMFSNSRVSAWGNANKFIDRFDKGDFVLYYERSQGIVAVGEVTSNETLQNGTEKYRDVSMIVPPRDGVAISPYEIKTLLHKKFYFATTAKMPYLSADEVQTVIDELNARK